MILVSGTLGSTDAENRYTVYTIDKDNITVRGIDGSKVYGTFIVKADGITIDNLVIQNKGDLGTASLNNCGGIYVFANNVTLTNNTITNGL